MTPERWRPAVSNNEVYGNGYAAKRTKRSASITHLAISDHRTFHVADVAINHGLRCERSFKSLPQHGLKHLLALAFVGQISRLGRAFFIFALVLFPSLFFLGLVTFERVLQSAIEDIVYARGINRIRHFYVERAPQVKDYFILSIHDNEAGAHGNMSMQASWWQLFLTTAGMIAVIDSIPAGVFAGLLIYQLFASPLLPCLSATIVIFLVVLVAHQRYQFAHWRRADLILKVLFPSDVEQQ